MTWMKTAPRILNEAFRPIEGKTKPSRKAGSGSSLKLNYAEILLTFAAWGPFWPSTISNSTSSPSARLL